jgi:hypothetical protein
MQANNRTTAPGKAITSLAGRFLSQDSNRIFRTRLLRFTDFRRPQKARDTRLFPRTCRRF